MIGDSLNFCLDSLGFAYDFAFCQNNGSPKIFQNVFWKKSSKNAKRYQVCWGAKISKQMGFGGSKFEKNEVPEMYF